MSELQEFLHMGGYAFYVWISFGVTFVVLLANVLWGRSQLTKMKQRAKTVANSRRPS